MNVQIKSTDTDQCWSNVLIEMTFEEDPLANSWVTKLHLLDELIVISGESNSLISAANRLLLRLESPSIKYLDISPDIGCLCLTDVSFRFASMMRKALMSRIPVFACSSVTVLANTTQYLDDFICHRVGQLAYEICDETELTAHLRLERSGKARGEDIKFSSSNCVTREFEKSIIAVLDENEELSLELHFEKNMALDNHDMFSAVINPNYKPEFTISKDFSSVARPILSTFGYTINEDYTISHADHISRKEAIQEILRNNAITDDCLHLTRNFVIDIESHGQHPPKKCAELAIAQIKKEIESFVLQVHSKCELLPGRRF